MQKRMYIRINQNNIGTFDVYLDWLKVANFKKFNAANKFALENFNRHNADRIDYSECENLDELIKTRKPETASE